jgi:hypothetical protein
MTMDEDDRKLLRGIAVDAAKAAASAARADTNASIAVQQGQSMATSMGARLGAVEGRLGNLEAASAKQDRRLDQAEQEIHAGVHMAPPDRDSVILPIAPGNDEAEQIAMDRSSGDLGIVVDVGAPESAPLPPMRKPAASITTEVARTRASVRVMSMKQDAAAQTTEVLVAKTDEQTTMLQGQTTLLQGIAQGIAQGAQPQPPPGAKATLVRSVPYTIGTMIGGFLCVVALQALNAGLQSCGSGHMSINGQRYSSTPAPILPMPSVLSSAPPPAPRFEPDPVTAPPPLPAKK